MFFVSGVAAVDLCGLSKDSLVVPVGTLSNRVSPEGQRRVMSQAVKDPGCWSYKQNSASSTLSSQFSGGSNRLLRQA